MKNIWELFKRSTLFQVAFVLVFVVVSVKITTAVYGNKPTQNQLSAASNPGGTLASSPSKREDNCPQDQKVYDDTRIALFKDVKMASGNSVLHDEATDILTSYAKSITHVNNWVVKITDVGVNLDGTCIIEARDDYRDHPYNLLLTNVPKEVVRKLTPGTYIAITGNKHFDWANGDFFPGEYKVDCSFDIIAH